MALILVKKRHSLSRGSGAKNLFFTLVLLFHRDQYCAHDATIIIGCLACIEIFTGDQGDPGFILMFEDSAGIAGGDQFVLTDLVGINLSKRIHLDLIAVL
jgi:hypothetical protein